MSKKITVEKFKEFILERVNRMDVGEKVEFTKEDKEKTLNEGKSFEKLTKIILSKIDKDRFTILVKGKKESKEDREFSNLDFNEVIKRLMELEKSEFGNVTHFFASKE